MPQIRYNNEGVGPFNDYSQSYDWNEYETLWNESLARNNKDNIFYQWFNSEETADRDFARQMTGQMYQNWYESAPEQMKRLKEAGINLNFGAGAVAGSAAGASPMSAPQSDTNAPLSELSGVGNALSNIVGTGSQIMANETAAGVNRATKRKLDTETDIMGKRYSLEKTLAVGQLAESLMNVGCGELEASMMAFEIADGGPSKALEYFKSAIGLRQYDVKMNTLQEEYSLRKKQVDKYDELINSEISKNNKDALKAEKDAALADLQAWFEVERKKLVQSIPYMQLDPVNQLLYLRETYGVGSPQYENALKSIQAYAYNENLGRQNAIVDTAYEKAYNDELGRKDVDIDYKAYETLLDVLGSSLMSFYKGALENPDNIQQLISTYLNDAVKALKSLGINFKPIENAGKPVAVPKIHR